MRNSISRRNFLAGISAASLLTTLKAFGKNNVGTNDANRPNILWIAVEDINAFLGCYGYKNHTPNLDKLAETGVRFENAFMPAPVCSPCRSSMITGMMPTTLGVHNHHSSRTKETAINLPDYIKTVPEIFKQAGYFTFNLGKDDYNFWYNREDLYTGEYTTHPLYGKSGKRNTGWKDRKPGQPFFGQIQLYGGKQIYGKSFKQKIENPVDRKSVDLPPYYPDHHDIREDWAAHLDSIQITDQEVGKIIEQLRDDGLLENTVVIFFSDHGMRLWRHKQFCYDSSLKVPFIINWNGNSKQLGDAGIVRNDLVNGMDIAATSLGFADIPIPEYMESRDLFADNFKERDYVISVRDRCDYTIDRIRTVRTNRFRYIRNFFPDRPYMQANYRDEWEITLLMRKLHADGKLDPLVDKFWSDERPSEELYDLENDPHEINNLAFTQAYNDVLIDHRKILTGWICQTDDKGRYPEDKANLKYMLETWRKRGVEPVNPEYGHLE